MRRLWGYFLVITLLVVGAVGARAEGVDEYRVKAALVLNFARFTAWPENAFSSTDTPLNVCVMGDGRLAEVFEPLEQKRIGTRPVTVTVDIRLDQSVACHVIFVADTERDKLPRLFSAIQDLPVLTIGETSVFTDSGGMINFVNIDGRLKFIVNLKNAQARKMNLSARLLKLAYAVKE